MGSWVGGSSIAYVGESDIVRAGSRVWEIRRVGLNLHV